MKNNPLQFAVVREDPQSLFSLISEKQDAVEEALLIASGGCQVLSLAGCFPRTHFVAMDLNPHQIAHTQRKRERLQSKLDPTAKLDFNIGAVNPRGLNDSGNFESLFRGFRELIHDLVCPYEEMTRAFVGDNIAKQAKDLLFSNTFWPVAFDLFFSDSILNAMFGPDATQHAEPGSYSSYFRERLEAGFSRVGAERNYFLHHIFLGHYLDDPDCWPSYLQRPPTGDNISYLQAGLNAPTAKMECFDLIDVSNIFDWMPSDVVSSVAERLNRTMKRGSMLVFRQLNNERDLSLLFPDFYFDANLEQTILEKDRSLFYNQFRIGVKQ